MRQVPFTEICDGCSGYTEVQSDKDWLMLSPNFANAGDRVVCLSCECTGVVTADTCGPYIEWDKICWSCSEDLDARLARLTQKIYETLHSKGVSHVVAWRERCQ